MSGELRIEAEWVGRGRCQVQVFNGKLVHVDTIDPTSAISRARLIKATSAKVPVLDTNWLDEQLIQIPPPPKENAPAAAPEDAWPDPVVGADLLDEVVSFLAKYLVLPEHGGEVLALWLAHTYLADVSGGFTPYIWVSSPVRQCGKSTLLELLSHLAYRGQMTGGITAAVLYRRIHRLTPTMLLDELDTRLRGDGGEALRGVLNTGFQQGGKVTICVGDNHEDQDFNTYCPKVLAGIGRLWDTVESRSIPLRLRRASREERKKLKKVRGDRIAGDCRSLAQKLFRFARDNRDLVVATEAEPPDELDARQSDIWRPLLAIAAVAGGDWPETANKVAKGIHGVAGEEGDRGLLLLEDLRELFARENADALFSGFIVDELVQREDRPWPEYRGDKSITKNGVASILKRFEVRPMTVRIGDETAKGYRLADLSPVFKHYLPTPSAPKPSVTSVTPQENTAKKPCDAGVTDDAPPDDSATDTGPPVTDDAPPVPPVGNPDRHARKPTNSSSVTDVTDDPGVARPPEPRFGVCSSCGGSALSATCRICRACYDAEHSGDAPGPKGGLKP